MARHAPGKHHREGISLIELGEMFPDEVTATAWFELGAWPDGRYCPRCGCTETTKTVKHKMPYWCPACRNQFSVTIGTLMEVQTAAPQVGVCHLPGNVQP